MSGPPYPQPEPTRSGGSGDDVLDRLERVEGRLAALEQRSEEASERIVTHRLCITDGQGRPRLTAELVDNVFELRIELPSVSPGGRTAVLLFAADGHAPGDLPSGVGVQLWVDGNLVEDLSWWEEER